jgi:hypothetical protein
VRVWIEAWQACCCGDPFSVGSEVAWRLNPVSADERSWFAEPLGDGIAASITHCENHHSGAGRVSPDLTRGRVESITAVYWSVGPRPGKTNATQTMRSTRSSAPRFWKRLLHLVHVLE